MAPRILNNLEADYSTLSSYYGVQVPHFNVMMFALGGRTDGTGGADHIACDATNIEVDIAASNPDRTSALLAVEVAEVLQTVRDKTVNCGYSNGEGLARSLSASLHPGVLNDFSTAPVWFQNGMPDYVHKTDKTDQNPESVGVAVLFYNWLHYQLGYSWEQIVRAGAPTLAETYHKLPGTTIDDPWALLQNTLQQLPKGPMNDNPFPIKVEAGK